MELYCGIEWFNEKLHRKLLETVETANGGFGQDPPISGVIGVFE
jgi:hypothetical protein